MFIYASYMIHSYLLLIFFIVSFLFFLFYFSPLFFVKTTHDAKKNIFGMSFDMISQVRSYSLLFPVSLFYIAIYGLVYSIFWENGNIVHYHTLIGSIIYLLFITYYLVIHSTNDIFYELLRYHTLIIITSWLIYGVLYGILKVDMSIFFVILLGFSLLTALQILFEYQIWNKEDTIFYIFFLFWLVTFIFLTLSLLGELSLFVIAIVIFLFAWITFFIFPTISLFSAYTYTTKYFSILSFYTVLGIWYFLLFQDDVIGSFLLVSPVIIFFLYIHALYENYISYLFAVISIFLLYISIFHPLLTSNFSSAFLFIFFLSAILIGATYFIKQKHSLDFLILHYASIFLSIGFSVYYLFIKVAMPDLLFFGSLFILGISTLSFMSYFRFRFDT